MHKLLRSKVTWVALAVAVVVVAGGLAAFQPWKAFTRSTVDEAIPVVFATPSSVAPSTSAPESSAPVSSAPESSAPVSSAPESSVQKPAGQRVLASGAFVSQEHTTSGTARVLEQNGVRLLRLEGFSTSDGPDVHVWLTDATAGGEWGKYDDGRAVKLGKIKATDGNQNYTIPADATLDGLRSVVIWCDRFNVAFGSAGLAL
jgi:electron transfer DM13